MEEIPEFTTVLQQRFRTYRAAPSRRERNDLAELHLGLARIHAKRYRSRGLPFEDLYQVGCVALIGAVERFDPDRSTSFRTFASRTIDGELKRFFRDRSWMVRPPRDLQERHLAVRRAQEDLTGELARVPTVDDVARRIGMAPEQVIESLEASASHDIVRTEDVGLERHMSLATIERGFDAVEWGVDLARVLEVLTPRQVHLLHLRFVEGLDQRAMAARIGVSQSYMSRCLSRTLLEVRAHLEGDRFATATGATEAEPTGAELGPTTTRPTVVASMLLAHSA